MIIALGDKAQEKSLKELYLLILEKRRLRGMCCHYSVFFKRMLEEKKMRKHYSPYLILIFGKVDLGKNVRKFLLRMFPKKFVILTLKYSTDHPTTFFRGWFLIQLLIVLVSHVTEWRMNVCLTFDYRNRIFCEFSIAYWSCVCIFVIKLTGFWCGVYSVPLP